MLENDCLFFLERRLKTGRDWRMIYDAHHSNMIHAADQNTAVISQKFQVSQAREPANNKSKKIGIPYLDVHKFTQKLTSISSSSSTARCARSIRIALQSAGANVLNHPIAASDWGRPWRILAINKFNRPSTNRVLVIFILLIKPKNMFMAILPPTPASNGSLILDKKAMRSIVMIRSLIPIIVWCKSSLLRLIRHLYHYKMSFLAVGA